MGVDLTEGNIFKTLYSTSLPLVVSLIMQTTLNLVDAFFVGKLNAQALAAISLSMPVTLMIMMVGSSIGAGLTSVVSRRVGSKEFSSAKLAADNGLLSVLFLSVLLTVASYLALPSLLDFMGASGSLKEAGLEYLSILVLGMVIQVIFLSLNGLVAAEGEMKVTMMAGIIANIINIILDPVFIFTWGLGLSGAAIATVIAQVAGLAYLYHHLSSGDTWVRVDFKGFRLKIAYIREIYSLALPLAVSNLILSISALLNMKIIGVFGTDALAASSIGFRLYNLMVLPGAAISNALVSIVGQSLGAGKYKRAREAVNEAGKFSAYCMGAISIVFIIFATPITAVFNNSKQVLQYCSQFLIIVPLTSPLLALAYCYGAALVAAGRGRQVLLLKVRSLISLIPAYIGSLIWGVTGIWIGMSAGNIIYYLMGRGLFEYGGWDRPKDV
jgi:putative MATE family efflux protein